MTLALSTIAVANVLSVFGAAAEIVGVGLVASEIRSDRVQAARLFAPPDVPDPPLRDFPSATRPSDFEYRPMATYGPRKAEDVEKRAAEGLSGVTNLAMGVFEKTVTHTDTLVHDARVENRDQIILVREDLREVLAGNARRRIVGVAAIGAGVVLATAGSIMGNV